MMRLCFLLLLSLSCCNASKLRRLRNTAVIVPDLETHRSIALVQEREAFASEIQELMEENLFEGFMRMEISMSFMSSPSTDGEDSQGETGDNPRDPVTQRRCGLSASERKQGLLEILQRLSNPSSLEDTSTPQYQAFRWLNDDDEAVICPDDDARVHQRYVLALFYYQFNGDSWLTCQAGGSTCFLEDSSTPSVPFLYSSNECFWYGISCEGVPENVALADVADTLVEAEDYHQVIAIDISDNNLDGELFDELFIFTELEELTLDGNKKISGSIPEAIGSLTNLIAIDIDDNALTGTIPDALYSLTELEAIDLNSNQLAGTISNLIGNLRNLVVVQLDDNLLEGPMPTNGLFTLENLAVWTSLDNDLTGSVERVCDVADERREQNSFPGYLQFFWVDCSGNPPKVECSCCDCQGGSPFF